MLQNLLILFSLKII